MVDIEADGPIRGEYSMICFGAVIVRPALDLTFYGRLKPISEKWVHEALRVSGFNREESLRFDEPADVMARFEQYELSPEGVETIVHTFEQCVYTSVQGNGMGLIEGKHKDVFGVTTGGCPGSSSTDWNGSVIRFKAR
jgi:hypothetical protein